MVGYNNAVFDYPFILAQNKRYKLDEKYHFKDYKQIDTMKIVKDLKKKGIINMSTFCFERNEKDNAKQETVAAFFNYNYEAHDSANDVKALMFIYKKVRQLDPTLI
jgi:hypothetical protein